MSKIDSDFSNKIKTWSVYEQKSQELKSQINKINESKDSLALEIIDYMKIHNLQKTAINLGTNKIYYHDDAQYNNLSFQFIKECLNIYFRNDQTKVDQLLDFIKSKRTKISKPALKCVAKKKPT
jgi:hypothetical protein